MNIAGEQILAVIGSLLALGICLFGLRDARWWEREDKALRRPRKKREPAGGAGPWGG